MSAMPAICDNGRRNGVATIVTLALGQAAAAATAAFATRDVFAAFRAETSEALPIVALATVALAGLAIAGLRYGERVVAERVGQDYVADLRVVLFKHLAHVSAREIANKRAGGLSLRFVGDLAAVRGWVSLGLARLISSLIVLPLATLALFLLNPALGAAASLPLVVGLIAMAVVGPALGPAHKKLRSRRARLAADMSERAPHAPELRLLGRVKTETRHIAKRTDKLIDAALERARGAALLRAIPDAVSGLAAACVFFVALSHGASGADAAGALAAVGLMIQPMRDLAGVWDRHRAWRVARDKCAALLNVPTLPRKRTGNEPALEEGCVTLALTQAQTATVGPIDASVPAGRSIAIIGPNGAGKSTLLSLAAGLEKPESGAVTLDGRPVIQLSTAERSRAIALIGGRSPILAGSLRRALTLGTGASREDDEIAAYAQRFGLQGVVDRLGGLDGKVAEGGRNLSAGEVRRLLLTRAALSDASILLLDEPDDALDQDGPALVAQLLAEVSATVLTITHNPDVAALMDEVWVIDGGHLVDRGPADRVLSAYRARSDMRAA